MCMTINAFIKTVFNNTSDELLIPTIYPISMGRKATWQTSFIIITS